MMTQEQFVEALPATGEVAYSDFLDQQRAQGNEKGVRMHLHNLRRRGLVVARVDTSVSPYVLYLSRPSSVG